MGVAYSSNSPFQKGAYTQTPDQKQVINYKEYGKLLLDSQDWWIYMDFDPEIAALGQNYWWITDEIKLFYK